MMKYKKFKVKTDWGRKLYKARMQTKKAPNKAGVRRPLGRDAFVAWINQNMPAGVKHISIRTYVGWEYGETNPHKRLYDAVSWVLDNCQLPKL